MGYKLLSITQKFKLKSFCMLCQLEHEGDLAVCNACKLFFKPIDYPCCFCAHPLLASNFLICGRCIKRKPNLDRTIARFLFDEPLRSVLHEFKYKGELYLTAFIAELMLENIPNEILETECLIPIPLHNNRLRKRGFNQSAELAKYLGRSLGIPIDLSNCIKPIPTLAQAELSGIKRRQNVRDAFIVNDLPYKNVTLIDDIITTGSTVNELARVIKKGRSTRVNAWCCARALYSQS